MVYTTRSPEINGVNNVEQLSAQSNAVLGANILAKHDREVTSIHVLRLVAMVLTEPFVDRVNAAGAGSLKEPVMSGGIKGFPRMFVHSPTTAGWLGQILLLLAC